MSQKAPKTQGMIPKKSPISWRFGDNHEGEAEGMKTYLCHYLCHRCRVFAASAAQFLYFHRLTLFLNIVRYIPHHHTDTYHHLSIPRT